MLHDRAEVGLDLHFGPPTVLRPRQAVVLLGLGEETFALPHPLGRSFEERGFLHRGQDLLKQVLVKTPLHQSLVRRTWRVSR